MAVRGPIRPETRLPLAAWMPLLDTLAEPVLLFDADGVVAFANRAAHGPLQGVVGQGVAALSPWLGAAATEWLQAAQRGAPRAAEPPPAELQDARRASLAWRRLDSGEGVLSLQPLASAPQQAFRVVWDAPFPATLQDAEFRLVDVNPAFLEFSGRTREWLIGRDPIEMQPAEDRPASLAAREAFLAARDDVQAGALFEQRLLDADGRGRWVRATRQRVGDDAGRSLLLTVMQDSTAEHAARERAERSARELDHWFDLSTVGMVLFDERSLLVRSNPAF